MPKVIITLLLFLMASTSLKALSCKVSASSLKFPTYDNTATTATKTTGTITVKCDQSQTINYVISLGAGSSGKFNPRIFKPSGTTATLEYDLYSGGYPPKGTIWGGTSTVKASGICTSKTPCTHTVYGLIPAGQDVTTGSFSAEFEVQLTWTPSS